MASIFFAWLEYPVLAVGVLGVLAFSSECSTGQIRTTFSAVPHRVTVLVAKAGVLGAVVQPLGEVLAFGAFFVSQAMLAGRHSELSLARAGAVRAVLAGGFSLFVVAMVGLSLGAIVRHTAGAVAALPAVLYLPLRVLSLPSPWADRIGSYTILIAAYQLVSLHRQPGLLSPELSLVVLVAWPAVLLVVGAIATKGGALEPRLACLRYRLHTHRNLCRGLVGRQAHAGLVDGGDVEVTGRAWAKPGHGVAGQAGRQLYGRGALGAGGVPLVAGRRQLLLHTRGDLL